jgi:predicted transcriptional regulator
MSRSSSESVRKKRAMRFEPSHRDIEFYRAFTSTDRPLTRKDLVAIIGCDPGTALRTLQFYFECGLVTRVFLAHAAWYTWAPKEEAADILKAIEAAAAIMDKVPKAVNVAPAPGTTQSHPTDDPVAQALRLLARLLDAAAEKLER